MKKEYQEEKQKKQMENKEKDKDAEISKCNFQVYLAAEDNVFLGVTIRIRLCESFCN